MRITDVLSYKHDGTLHRVWKNVRILFEDAKMLVVLNDRVEVIDGDGHLWRTKEPAICFFYKDFWFNVVCMIRDNSLYYYCNLASPYVIDSEGIKYIDYDLDVKLYPNGEIKVIDEDEFVFDGKIMHYPKDIKAIVLKQKDLLIKQIENRLSPFNQETIDQWYQMALVNGWISDTNNADD